MSGGLFVRSIRQLEGHETLSFACLRLAKFSYIRRLTLTGLEFTPLIAVEFRDASLQPLAFQLRVHCDFGVQQPGNWAAFLCIFCRLIEFGFICARNLGLYLQVA